MEWSGMEWQWQWNMEYGMEWKWMAFRAFFGTYCSLNFAISCRVLIEKDNKNCGQ